MNTNITVEQLKEHFDLRCLTIDSDLSRVIEGSYVAYAGLALAGWLDDVSARRVVLLDSSAVGYLESLSEELVRDRLRGVFQMDISCLVLHSRIICPDSVLEVARDFKVPILVSKLPRLALQLETFKWLRSALAPREIIHGVMMDVCGIGTLLLGKSGVGKSECALELVKRGHRLVCDDAVLVKRIHGDKAVAEASGKRRYYMELRGIGLIHVPSLFGVGAITDSKDIDLVVRLELPEPGKRFERLGIEQPVHSVLGVTVPLVEIPVVEGKNLSILIEAAAMNQHLRALGVNAARIFTDQLSNDLQTSPTPLLSRQTR